MVNADVAALVLRCLDDPATIGTAPMSADGRGQSALGVLRTLHDIVARPESWRTIMSNEDGILIIGRGFAGVWAAAAASRVRADAGLGDRDLPITVVSDRRDLMIRPRLYEADPRRMRVPLRDMLDPAGVRQVHATVTGVTRPPGAGRDGPTSRIRAARRSLGYGRLVLAAGSRVARPDLAGAGRLFDVDSGGATRLNEHLHLLAPASRPARPGTPWS